MSNKLDLTGQKFGRLTVIAKAKEKVKGGTGWTCLCDCGNQIIVVTRLLRSGNTKSCGCLQRETASKQFTKHGFAKCTPNRFYRIWAKMRNRCNNPNESTFKYYGGKGIKVCERWADFSLFFNDMNPSYEEHVKKYGEKNTTLDRIDNSKDYEPNNCRWATRSVQSNNKSTNKIIEYNGESHNLTEWSKILGIARDVLQWRIYRGNWSIEKTLTTPVKRRDNPSDTIKTKTS